MTDLDRLQREALARLHHSINTRAGIALARIRAMAQRMRERMKENAG